MNTRIALVSAREALALDEDMPPLRAALTDAGAMVETPSWDDPQVHWESYSAAVLRSTWDYVDRIGEFLPWAERCARQTRLINPPEMIRWNTDKHYLADLARTGIPVVPTRFVEPGAPVDRELGEFLGGGTDAMTVGSPQDFAEFVVKPSIGAGSRDTARYVREDSERARSHLARLLRDGRSAMLQPYLGRVDVQGETAVVYLGGEFSHAFRKGPLLRPGSGLVEGLFAPEEITPRRPDARELEVAWGAYSAIGPGRPMYARIDLIRDDHDAPILLELELTEPSLYFRHAPGSAERFARVLLDLLREHG